MAHFRHKWIVVSSCRFRLIDGCAKIPITKILYKCADCGKHKTKQIWGWFDDI